MLGVNAHVQMWAKGFRVSERSSEFQLVVPLDAEQLVPGEQCLTTVSWGEILQPLYRLQHASLAEEFAVLLDESSSAATLIAAAHSEDKSDRRSIVVLGATVGLDWRSDDDLAVRMGRAHSLAARLAETYGDVLRGCRPEVEKQLRDGRFLRSREFSLDGEDVAGGAVDWSRLSSEIKRWKGITGVASRHFVDLGANILVGTRDEAERARSSGLDGYYDLARAEIVPLGSQLTLWPDKSAEPAPAEREPTPDPIEAINGRLDRLEEQQIRTHGLLESLYRAALSFWGLSGDSDGRPEKRKKKKR